MAKGFPIKPDKQLGYILVLMPEMKVYAAKFSLNMRGSKEIFIGITNMLEEAQVWSNRQEAKRAFLIYYDDLVREKLQRESEVRVSLKGLKRTVEGELKTEPVETWVVSGDKLP